MADALRKRKGNEKEGSAKDSPEASKPKGAEPPEFNPLTLQAVGAIFKRRWAAPLTVAIVCVALHFTGVLDDPNAPPSPKGAQALSDATFDIYQKMHLPLHYAKYGAVGGALFGSAMWGLVVSLSDAAEGKPDPKKENHWAHNNTLLFGVLLALGTMSGAIVTFVAVAVTDVIRNGIVPGVGGLGSFGATGIDSSNTL